MPLSRAAKAYRVGHLAWGAAQVAALARVWASALGAGRSGRFWAAVAFLGVQGAGLLAARGDCPMTPVQRRLGDRVPMFELFLPRRAAKAAVPVLASVALLGVTAALARGGWSWGDRHRGAAQAPATTP
jgi:hypothetical protein